MIFLLCAGLTRFAQFVERPNVSAAAGFAGVFLCVFFLAGARFQ